MANKTLNSGRKLLQKAGNQFKRADGNLASQPKETDCQGEQYRLHSRISNLNCDDCGNGRDCQRFAKKPPQPLRIRFVTFLLFIFAHIF